MIATPTGPEIPAVPLKLFVEDTLVPLTTDSVILLFPEFAIQRMFWPSIAIDVGVLRPVAELSEPAPAGVKTLNVEFPEFGTQALPFWSKAMDDGALSVPPVRMVGSAVVALRTVIELLPLLATHKFPAESTAEADGVLNVAAGAYFTASVKSARPVAVGWKGEAAVARFANAVTLLPGYFAILSAAVTVSVGAAPPGGVEFAKRVPQAEPSPATPPVELMHAARMSPSVFSLEVGAVAPVGSVPGDCPRLTLTSLFTEEKALVRPVTLVDDVPSERALDMKGARAKAPATVVSSLTEMKVEEVRLPQAPRGAIRAAFGFVPPPGLPPIDVAYTSVAALGQV